MNITWLGQSCFRIEEKIGSQTVTIITDPYDGSIGLKLPKQRADLVSISHNHPDHNNYLAIGGAEDKAPVIIDRPGEYEVKSVFALGIGSYHDNEQGAKLGKSVMFKFDIGGIKILHLGDLGTSLSDAQLERIEDIDILLIPVGGRYTLNAKEAAEVALEIEPRIVIPMHYKIPGLNVDIDGVEKFQKEMGSKAEFLPKLKISKKDLPQDEVKLIILQKE